MIRGERGHIQFRGFSPAERDSLVQALGNKITVQESPWDCILMGVINHEKKPFDDKRVRQALTLALDRYEGSKALSRIAIVKDVAGVQVPGHAVRHIRRASWRSSPATGVTSTPRAPRRGGSSRRPAPRISPSRSRTAAFPCPTSPSPSG